MADMYGERPSFTHEESRFKEIRTWFQNKIESSESKPEQDMLTDAMGIYEIYDPGEEGNIHAFELLNERLVQHGIRTGDLEIIDLALPYTKPDKRWDLLADLFEARKAKPEMFPILTDEKIISIIQAIENCDYVPLDSSLIREVESETAFHSLSAWFRMNISGSENSNSVTDNRELSRAVYAEFNRMKVYFRTKCSSDFGDMYSSTLIEQIKKTHTELANICARNKIDSKFVTDEYIDFPSYQNLIVRASMHKLSDCDIKYIDKNTSSGDPLTYPHVMNAMVAKAVDGILYARHEVIDYLTNNRDVLSPLRTEYYLFPPLRMFAPNLYFKLLPYLYPEIANPQDVEDLIRVNYPDARKLIQDELNKATLDFNPALGSAMNVGKNGDKAFWLALYMASTPELHISQDQHQLLETFLDSKDRFLVQISKIPDTSTSTEKAIELFESSKRDFIHSQPYVDGATEINAYLDIIAALGSNKLSNPTLITELVDKIQRQYRILKNRKSQQNNLRQINMRIDQILEENESKEGPSRLGVLGLDILLNLKTRNLVKPHGGPIQIGKNSQGEPYL